MMLKAILFDLGGTLMHYHDPHEDDPRHPFRRVTMLCLQSLLEQLAPKGFTPAQLEHICEAIERHIGISYQAMQAERCGGSIEAPIRAGLSEVGIIVEEKHWPELRSYLYRPIDQIVSIRQGVEATLAELRDVGYKLGLISNTFWAADLHDRHLAEYGLLDFLPTRVYSSDEPYQKPHPSIFSSALELMDVHAAEAAYVGDRVDVDVQGAQQVGMRGILIRSPYQPTSINDYRPEAIIEELPDLISAVADLQTATATTEK
ncbi:MAG: HAD family hydrolase [Anaerolineae bacterium]|nr:HAD family hydrolase [Anaerolineae bacterium]